MTIKDTTQTATVSDEAVQAASIELSKNIPAVIWMASGMANSDAAMRLTLTAALPHLALSPAEPVDQWQDIATAPKDGESILIWKPDERMVGEYLMSAYWCDDRVGFVPVGGIHKQGYYSDTAQCNQGYPTHWMPLPAAPTSKGV